VYDVSALLRPSERAAPTNPPDGGVGTEVHVGILLLALLVVALWAVRLRRRRVPRAALAHLVVCALATALVLAIAGAFAVRLTRVSPDAAALVVLLVLGGLSFWRPARKAGPAMAPRRTSRSRAQVLLTLAGAALLLVGAGVATVASLKEWTPPPELALTTTAGGKPVAQVQLGSAGPVSAQLLVAHGSRLVWATDLALTAAAQNVKLPAVAASHDSRVALVVNGKALRLVGS